jgi:hypothetical protein
VTALTSHPGGDISPALADERSELMTQGKQKQKENKTNSASKTIEQSRESPTAHRTTLSLASPYLRLQNTKQ